VRTQLAAVRTGPLEKIFKAPTAEASRTIASGADSMQLFHNLTLLKHGAFTGCSSCELVCPVGDDFKLVEQLTADEFLILNS